MEHLQHHVYECLKASVRTKRKITEITQQLYAIDNGFKSGFLWDVGNLSVNDVKRLLDSLKEVNRIANSLVVLRLGNDPDGDFGVCDINRFVGEQFRPVFLDVSYGLPFPRLAQQSVVNFYDGLTVSLRTKMKSHRGLAVVENDRQVCTPVMQWPLAVEVCRPTVYGIFVGYPVVYWYDTQHTQENCLSHVPLVVFQASIKPQKGKTFDPIISFSVPEKLLDEPAVADVISLWKKAIERFNLNCASFKESFSNVIM